MENFFFSPEHALVETTQEKILALLREKPSCTQKELAFKIGISTNGVKYHIGKLKSEGIIRHIVATKTGCWEIVTQQKN